MKKNTVKIMTLAGILCLASVGGVSAYLTDYEKVSNEFTVGKVDIELKEPSLEQYCRLTNGNQRKIRKSNHQK